MEGGPFGGLEKNEEWMLYVGQLALTKEDKELLYLIGNGEKNGALTIKIIRNGIPIEQKVDVDAAKSQEETVDELTGAFDQLAGEPNDLPELSISFEPTLD